MNRHLYALHDQDPQGTIPVVEGEARELNQRGYGIFWTVNEFRGRRLKDNLVRLNSWYVEIDDLPKSEQEALILASPVPPHLIIESKNGYHIYWHCREATVGRYADVQAGLRYFFTGDPNAKDVARILRAPGYFHMKDPSSPFLVSKVHELLGTYSERLMIYNFPPPKTEEKAEVSPARKLIHTNLEDDFWDRAASIDCEEGLLRLSGTEHVRGEVYSFRRVMNGHLNIVVNGKPTSCFIDSKKRIGSSDKGGPTIAMWLRWFGHSYKDVYRILNDVFPELKHG